ncbi:hypothetical protein SmJEL517_g06090 [Synchytrium microbalum]|uniref:Uncharacterized protein n=1 Tax=Synchytrium microbalum TaxID=1806994 RepID=A0A507BYB3_9FUNG|nr:uncharacterized protein SmJEL517_g06090 [Synchytrium microbalum]TPX30325.1 hypothetical protein SmJEL517_g06090 [Synchytrium microbalum]
MTDDSDGSSSNESPMRSRALNTFDHLDVSDQVFGSVPGLRRRQIILCSWKGPSDNVDEGEMVFYDAVERAPESCSRTSS